MNFTIYYRGQTITTVEAKTEAAALKAYAKRFSPGTKGTVVAIGDDKTVAEHQVAIEASTKVPA